MIDIQHATDADIKDITGLIHCTISECYPSIYSNKVVRFFLNYHSFDEITRRFQQGQILLLKKDSVLIGTGFLVSDEIGGVYVHPNFQRQGYGRTLVEELILLARTEKCKRIWLDSTPLAKPLYEALDFKIVCPMVDMVEDQELPYFKMEIYL